MVSTMVSKVGMAVCCLPCGALALKDERITLREQGNLGQQKYVGMYCKIEWPMPQSSE
jgi:hypothetical protein